jgi:hypothetical protein
MSQMVRVRSADSALAEAPQTGAEEPDSLASATEWLGAAPRRLSSLEGEELIAAVTQIDDTYDQFPELEIAIPRRALVDELRAALDRTGAAALPLLMVCAALDTTPAAEAVAALLDGMVRAGQGETSARVVAILARRRAIAGDEVAPAVAELCRQGDLAVALALSAQASGDGDQMAAVALGAGLQRLLCAGDGAATDPSGLARTILSARHRVRRSIRPPGTRSPGAPGSTPGLLELAERVAAKLPRQPLSPPPIATRPISWPTGRLDFAEFAAQWPEACDVAIEWLPAMRVGGAGEPRHDGISAKLGQAGHLVYGPYVNLGAGDYRVRVHWRAGRPARRVSRGRPVATIEIVSSYGKTYLAQHQLRAEDCLRPEHEVMFHIGARPPPAFPVEVRVWSGGAVPLTVSSITVERIAGPTQVALTG